MGLLDKVESTLTLGILAVAGYVFIKNYDTLKELWCKIPGVCDGTIIPSPTCDQYIKRASCDAQGLLFDLNSCSCTTPIPDPGLLPVINPCPGNKPMHYTVVEGLHCDATYIPPTEAEVCKLFGKVWDGENCITPETPISGIDDCEVGKGGIWNSFTNTCCVNSSANAPCYCENPPGSGCYPNATSPGGEHCNVNCNTRCSDIFGNYKLCDSVDPLPDCPEGQVRDTLGAGLCIPDTSECQINMMIGGWMTLEEWRNRSYLWDGNVKLGDNGHCQIGIW